MWTLQELINSGAIWSLEGSAGRGAMDAIGSGLAILGPEGHHDYWGNYVPSRFEVQAGTKGSLQYANRLRAERGLRPLRQADFDLGRPAVQELADEYEWRYGEPS